MHFQNLISRPVTIALQTANPEVAQARSAALSVRFATVTMRLKAMYFLSGEFLTRDQIRDIYRAELREAPERALGPIYRSANLKEAMWQTSLLAEAYGVARRLDRPDELTAADEEALRAKGFSQHDIEFIRCDLDLACSSKTLRDDEVVDQLAAIEADISRETIELARPHILRARAEAYRRASHLLDPEVQDAPDPVEALLSERYDRPAIVSSIPGSIPARVSVPLTTVPEPGPNSDNCPFLIYVDRRFGDVIDDIVERLRGAKTWKGACAQ